jgi:hypothetical protein
MRIAATAGIVKYGDLSTFLPKTECFQEITRRDTVTLPYDLSRV